MEIPNPKHQIPRFQFPKQLMRSRWSLDILRLCLGFGFGDLELPLRGPSVRAGLALSARLGMTHRYLFRPSPSAPPHLELSS
jgi:hypothetical protein